MRIGDIILRKRDGERLSDAELRYFVQGYTEGRIPDYQAAAYLMAVYFRGMDSRELAVWTDCMMRSGELLDLSRLQGRKIDKHSTGGVGDKVSICLAPLVAACGVGVPMISGRGLGHTGGTLDKLEAIPGFCVDIPPECFVDIVEDIGFCMAGQTESLVPADRKLYALRDVTATVESVPLIASSILSKKLAEGIDGLVMDVKVGRGAFMKTMEDALELADTIVELGGQMGTRVVALITGMDQPLGNAVGNALETREALEVLMGKGPDDLVELTLTLAAEMLLLGEAAGSLEEGRAKAKRAIEDGSALERMGRLISRQNGDPRVIEDLKLLPSAKHRKEVRSPSDGWIESVDAEKIGRAAMRLGAGRDTKDDVIDPAVGLVLHRKVGEKVAAGDILCEVHLNDPKLMNETEKPVLDAFSIVTKEVESGTLIKERIG